MIIVKQILVNHIRVAWLVFLWLPISAYFYKAVDLVNPTSGKRVILLGDFHLQNDMVVQSDREAVQEITLQQKQQVARCARQLGAEVLVETMGYGTPGVLREPIKLLGQELKGKNQVSVLDDLIDRCVEQGVSAGTIDYRFGAHVAGFLAYYSPFVLTAIWLVPNIVTNCRKIFTEHSLRPLCALGKKRAFLLAGLGTIPLVYLAYYLYKKYQLGKQIAQHPEQQFLQTVLQQNYRYSLSDYLKFPYYLTSYTVDLSALTKVLAPDCPQTMIVCTGAAHTQEIKNALQQKGYSVVHNYQDARAVTDYCNDRSHVKFTQEYLQQAVRVDNFINQRQPELQMH